MTCCVDGCHRQVLVKSRALCRRHYRRWQRHGNVNVVKPPGFLAQPRLVCDFDGCDQPTKRGGRGWCDKHYTRWYRHGDPSVDGSQPRRVADVMDRIRSRIAVNENGCWIWQGQMMPNGYGQIGVRRRHTYVHRAAYEYVHGSIPRGMHVHHLCHTRACCNPEHLDLLTPFEHARVHREEVHA